MERGTIYWDESSRGKNGSHADTDKRRGRWVGERRENGRRVRFRSTDYDKVLAWIQHGPIDNIDIRQLVGMKYKVNIRTGDVIGCGGKILTPHSRGGCTYTLSKRGKHYSVTNNRIMYAAIHNIDVLKMPTDIVVSKTDEGYKLMYRKDISSRCAEKVNAAKRSNIIHLLTLNQKELHILKNFYETGHTSEIIAYGMNQFDVTVRYLLKYYTVNIRTASDVAAEAIEQFCERIIKGTASTLNITGYIRSISRQIIAKRSKEKTFEEYDKIKTKV